MNAIELAEMRQTLNRRGRQKWLVESGADQNCQYILRNPDRVAMVAFGKVKALYGKHVPKPWLAEYLARRDFKHPRGWPQRRHSTPAQALDFVLDCLDHDEQPRQRKTHL